MDARIVTETHPATRRHPAMTAYAIDGNLIAVGLGEAADHSDVFDPCTRCGWGLGSHSFNGMDSDCYLCGGNATGDLTTLDDAVRRFDARMVRQAREADKRRVEALQAAHELAQWLDANPTIVTALKPFETRNGFLGDMARTVNEGRILTQKQHDAVVSAFLKMAERAAAAGPGHWSEVGVRAEVTATVTLIRQLADNGFGPSLLIKLRTEEGHELVTFTTAAWGWTAEVGDAYTGKATVKKHDEFNGTAQTVITRAKFEPVSGGGE